LWTLPASLVVSSRWRRDHGIVGRLSRRRFFAVRGGRARAAGGITCPRLVFAQNKKGLNSRLLGGGGRQPVHFRPPRAWAFWDKYGLDVDIARGSGSLAASQAIGEGRFDFGMFAAVDRHSADDQRVAAVALAACAYDATMGIGVMNDGPIKTPKDLEGRKMASVATSGDYPFLPLFPKRLASIFPR